ncbi:MAG: M50 family metallopeptidase [Christensenella sp.]|nr:M50 family metallopeptidase [Christensenella sp.]
MQTSNQSKPSTFKIIPFVIFLLGGLICGAFIGWSLANFTDRLPEFPYPLALAIMAIILTLAFFAQLIIHEAGHLVFGLLSGYRFSSFRVGSLMLFREDGHLRLKSFSLAGTGGQCLMIPPQGRENDFPFARYLLGGVWMNFLVGALFALLYLLTVSGSLVSVLFGAIALTGFAVGLMNAIPLHMAMVDNDGYTVRSMRKDPQAVAGFYQMMQIHSQVAAGFRLKDLPEEWFVTPPSADTGNSMIATIEVYRCNRLLDEAKPDQAAESIRALLASGAAIAGIHRSMLVCDLAYCALMLDDPSEATRLLDEQQLRFMKSMMRFPGVLRTQYALALLRDHDTAAAAAFQARFDRMAERYPYQSDIASERALMNAAQKKGSPL